MKKEIKRITSASSHRAGEHMMYQPIPSQETEQIDPFILLHHHGPHEFKPYNQGLPFGPHPHRGFETLTLVYEGDIEHADSQGFSSVIHPGGIQWMTAARGIVHSENISAAMREHGGKMEIIQLWMNLPGRLKMTAPNYQGLENEQIPRVLSDDQKIDTQLISGTFKGVKGAAKSITDLEIFSIYLKEGGEETYSFAAERSVFLYALNGEVMVNDKLVYQRQMVEFKPGNTDIQVSAKTDARVLLCSGEPLNEPMVAQGPFVMNTTTEIMQAMRDYQMGKMGVM